MNYSVFDLAAILLALSFASVGITYSLFGYYFDKLIRHEYKNYPDKWESDGKPNGVFWTAPKSSFWASGFRRPDLLASKWAEEKPEWVWEDSIATDLYNCFKFFRRLVYVNLFLLFSLGFLNIFLSIND